MINVEEVARALTPDIYQRFRQAIEIGKWPDGRQLTPEQKETCIQAVIAYEHKHIDEADRTGYVPPKKTLCDAGEDETIRWK